MSARERTWKERVLLALAPRLLSAVLQVLRWTVRVEFVGADELFRRWRAGEPSILTFWHNRLVMMPIAYDGPGLYTLNSQSRDGEIATRAVERWGIRSVRGSARRGGAAGLLALVRAFRRGSDLAVVPDGPRGPRGVVKPGIVHLAAMVGAPVFPVSYGATRFRQLRSWDRLVIPLPFARVCFAVGEPLAVGRDIDEAAVERLRLELERRLHAVTKEAEDRVGTHAE